MVANDFDTKGYLDEFVFMYEILRYWQHKQVANNQQMMNIGLNIKRDGRKQNVACQMYKDT